MNCKNTAKNHETDKFQHFTELHMHIKHYTAYNIFFTKLFNCCILTLLEITIDIAFARAITTAV